MLWIAPGQTNVFTNTMFHLTEPILAPLRRILPTWKGLDFSPVVAVVILQVIVQLAALI